ncbi:MAG: type II toxin-antitoxin system RelE/ParE family toxin [Chloroflexi bacterium]|nr:type II toxin-antitoxin system RelE/ParE family toxin [Chloroflexota bacterium]
MNTVAETLQYQRKAKSLLSRNEQEKLIDHLSKNPKAGVLIRGTGGIRKLRWGRSDRGKRAGIRVIYYYHSELMPLYLLTVFGKSEKADLSQDERQLLAQLVRRLVQYWRGSNESSI